MKTKKIIGMAIAGVLILGSGLYVYYNAVTPKGQATGKAEKQALEILNIDKIFRVADINNDKVAEIILLKKTDTGADKIYIVDSNGNCFDGWPKEVESPAIGDVNNDGYKEIIGFSDDKVYVYDQFGIQLTGFPMTLASKSVTIPALVDLDKDNFLKIIWGTREPETCINALSGDGYVVPEWPKELVTLNADMKQADAQMPMAIADMNNDGKTEVVVFAYNKIFVIATEQNDGGQ